MAGLLGKEAVHPEMLQASRQAMNNPSKSVSLCSHPFQLQGLGEDKVKVGGSRVRWGRGDACGGSLVLTPMMICRDFEVTQ